MSVWTRNVRILLVMLFALPVPVTAQVAVGSKVEADEPAFDGEPCGEVLFNSDGRIEAAYAWQYGGVQAPYYGAFAEGYSTVVQICSVFFDFGQISQQDQTMDVYVWEDSDGVPGAVLAMEPSVDPGAIFQYPDFSRHSVPVSLGRCTPSAWWVGYWGDWPDALAGWFIGADLDGTGGGRSKSNFAPGLGYPTGWQNLSVAWGATQALHIGAEVIPCEPTPTVLKSWGDLKARLGTRPSSKDRRR